MTEPSISVLIPTKNRHPSLPRTLALVRATGLPAVLCDQSPQPYAGAHHRPDLPGLPAARNVLLTLADTEVVVFMDDDTDLHPRFADQLAEAIRRWPEAAGWGPVLEVRSRRIRRLHRLAQLGCFRDERRLTGAPIDAATGALFGACFAVRRDLAQAVGFDGRLRGYGLGEDIDFCRRTAERIGNPRPFRFVRGLRAIHRNDSANRADPRARGRAKGHFLLWWARRHGRTNPCTFIHLLLALAAAAIGHGREASDARGVWEAVWGS